MQGGAHQVGTGEEGEDGSSPRSWLFTRVPVPTGLGVSTHLLVAWL